MAGDKILVFGATGPAGILLLRELLFRNHATIAYVRTPSKIPADLAGNPLLEVVKGELNDEATLSSAVARSSIVVSLLGPDGFRVSNPNLYGEFYRRLFPLLRQHGVRRILAASTPSADEPQDRFHLPTAVLVFLVRWLGPGAYKSVRGAAQAFQESAQGLDWTVFRLAYVPGHPDAESWRADRERPVHAGYVGDGTWSLTINRSALARWLVDAVENEEAAKKWVGKLPAVSVLPASKKKTA